jgi:hypothetical protein
MARSLFRGAPELSRLFGESPIDLFSEFIAPERFPEILPPAVSTALGEPEVEARRDAVRLLLGRLSSDRLALVEKQARRITAMADTKPELVLRRLGEDIRFRAQASLAAQRDALARSLWAYLKAESLFEAAQRAMQVDVYREHVGLYERWSVGTSIALAAEAIDTDALETEIASRLHREDGCKVESVDLPSEDGTGREVLLAVTFFGSYSSQKTVRPDRSTSILYYRPPDEMLLVYSPDRQCIEVCARDPTERRLVANIFAEDALEHDILNKPLTQKTYNLARFRKSLKLEIPERETHRVRRVCLTEVQVALGDWARKVTLSVGPDDDLDATAREVFGGIIPRSGQGYITKVHFHIEHLDGLGRAGTLRFDVFGRNKSSIQSERDPTKRALGYDLLEAWGVLERVGDLTLLQRREKLPQLLALYDLPEAAVSGPLLDDLGIIGTELAGAGYLIRKGWASVVLFEDDELGDVLHHVEGDNADKQLTLRLPGGGPRLSIPAEDLSRYEIQFAYLRDTLRDVLKPLGLKGRVREISRHIHQLGTAKIGLAEAPVFLARGLSDDKVLELTDRLVRGEHSLTRGIVFVPQDVRFPYLGCHVVLSLRDHLEGNTGQIDLDAVRVAYEASVDPASRGQAVEFRKQSNAAGQIIVPEQDPLIITGVKKVLLFERLYAGHVAREPGVKLATLKEYAGFSQLPQLFGEDWPSIKDRYIYSPRHGFWALCETSISA